MDELMEENKRLKADNERLFNLMTSMISQYGGCVQTRDAAIEEYNKRTGREWGEGLDVRGI